MKNAKVTESCFVIMPFGEMWDEYYTQLYLPAITEAGLNVQRADDVFRAGSILQDIVGYISQAAVVLVDISENNRNVHYELGLAHALGKPTLLIAHQEVPEFFDVGHDRILRANKNEVFWGEKLKRDLVNALRGTLREPERAIPTVFMHIKPTRVEVDEVAVRLRRIDDQLEALVKTLTHPRPLLTSNLAEKIHSLDAAVEEAAKLLRTLPREAAIRQLMIEGYREAMAQAAVARAIGSVEPKRAVD
jgi:hypothetical protein